MKSSIIILLLTLGLISNAQIAFEGQPEPLSHLNSPNGQNYLVLDPNSGKMAFTEERPGNGEQNDLDDYVHYVDSMGVYFFYDWLGVKRMASPIGFDGEDLIYNHVFFNQGVYHGLIMRLKNRSKERVPEIIPFFKNKSREPSGCLSNDGQFMVLSAESNHSYGVEDLYVVERRPDGSWTQLKNLGSIINTQYQEITPFLAADNRTLFFASNRPGGSGSFDIYYSIRKDNYWRDWTEPKRLGSQINTSGSESSFTFRDNEEWAYFVRSQDSDGYGDIMRIRFKEDIEADTIVVEEPVEEMTVEEVVANEVMLEIVDKKTDAYLTAQLIFDSLILPVPEGVFVLDSSFLAYGEVEIKSEGYLPVRFSLENNLIIGANKIAMEPVKKGETIALSHVLFHRGTPDLIEDSFEELDLVVEMMNDNPNIKILLKGHTDNTGDPVKNVELSEARVRAVKEYIISQGISPYRVTGKGYGGNQPLYSNETEETRKLNRRVEFEVIED